MDRKNLDRLFAAGGLVIAAVLLVAGGLLTWAHSYVRSEVHDQLVAQQIFFPAQGSAALASPQIGPYLDRYAGQQLLTGDQAKAWADHFIAVHIAEMTGGKTYAQVSAQAIADPSNTKLAAEVDTVFKGETLRGLLLNAYAFDTMGNLALLGAIVAYVGAGLMFILSALGFAHARRIHAPAPGAGDAPAIETVHA
jgi:hypothetical protein